MGKNTLRTIKLLHCPYKLLSKFKRIIRKASRIVQLKSMPQKEQLRVGFIVQLPSIWDKQVDIYNEMLRRNNIEVFLFAVPQYDWSAENIDGKDVDHYLKIHYPELIEICKYKDITGKMLEYRLDYLFYPRPYDHYLPKELRSESLYQYINCCYIPYGMSGADVFNGGNIYNTFFDNISIIYMDSLSQYNLMHKQYRLSSKLRKRRIKYFGYPVLYKYLFLGDEPKDICITWTPRWSTDPIIGGSNFIKYADSFLDLVKNKNCKFIFRPHPLMFDELVTKGVISQEYKKNYIAELKKYHVDFNISSTIDEIFQITSILITDYSSIIPQFFLTSRPIIYCETGIELNQTFQEMIDLNYRVDRWEDVIRNLDVAVDEPFEKIKKRKEYISKNFKSMGNPSIKIVDDLINGKAR